MKEDKKSEVSAAFLAPRILRRSTGQRCPSWYWGTRLAPHCSAPRSGCHHWDHVRATPPIHIYPMANGMLREPGIAETRIKEGRGYNFIGTVKHLPLNQTASYFTEKTCHRKTYVLPDGHSLQTLKGTRCTGPQCPCSSSPVLLLSWLPQDSPLSSPTSITLPLVNFSGEQEAGQ